MSKPEISKMLTLSTAHVTDRTMRLLDEEPEGNDLSLAVYPKSEFGYIIYIPEPDELLCDGEPWTQKMPHEWPKDLWDVLLYARDLSCDILCLDGDGPEIPYLKSYPDETNSDRKRFNLVIRDGNGEVDVIVLHFLTDKYSTPDSAVAAARRAVQEYLKTPTGRRDYAGNCDDFNWGDAINSVPNDYFIREGLIPDVEIPSFEKEVEHDEDLVGTLYLDEEA